MKKVLVILIVTIIFLTGCKQENLNRHLFYKVMILEKNDYLFENLKLDYYEYTNKINDVISEEYTQTYIDDRIIFFFLDPDMKNSSTQYYRGKDMKDITVKELEKLKIQMDKLLYNNSENNEIVVRVTGVYDVDVKNKNWKAVYSREIKQEKNDIIHIVDKRYTFENQDGTWKIVKIDKGYKGAYDETSINHDFSKEDLINNFHDNAFSKKKLDYLFSFNIHIIKR